MDFVSFLVQLPLPAPREFVLASLAPGWAVVATFTSAALGYIVVTMVLKVFRSS
jgi:hypothetical protein